jgi:Flp pilus assembly protein TadB
MWTVLLNPRVIAALAVAAALAASHWWAWTHGARAERLEWVEAQAEVQAKADAELAAQRQETARVAAQYEAQRAAIQRRLTRAHTDLRNALQRPISCPAGDSQPVGDVVIPADALRVLRDAGADPGQAKPGAGSADR